MAGGLAPILLLGGGIALAAKALRAKKGPPAPPAAPGVAPSSGTFETDANIPAQLEQQVLGAIKSVNDPAELERFAAQLDAQGFHLAAAALRQRAAELQQHGAPAPPPGPAPAAPPGPLEPPSPGVAPGTIGPVPQQPLPAGISGLDDGMDSQTRQAVIGMLTTETDVAKLQGMAAAIQFKYPIAAGLLWAKAAAQIATQAPAGPAAPIGGGSMPTPPQAAPSQALPPAPSPFPAPVPAMPAPTPQPTAGPPPGHKWVPATDADVSRDGLASRYQQLSAMPVGTEQQELHNNHLWKLRVVSAATDPGLTTYAKDVKGWIATLVQGVLPTAPPAPAPAPAPPLKSPIGVVQTPADIQAALNQLGYGPLAVDGIIGPKSQAATKRFQMANGLTVDGIPGPKTKAALQAALQGQPIPSSSLAQGGGGGAPAILQTTAPAAQQVQPAGGAIPVVSQTVAVSAPVTVQTNTDVQRALNALGYTPALVVDGAIGPKSQAAVKWFQRSHGLTVDGIPGPITKAALQAALSAQGLAPVGVMS